MENNIFEFLKGIKKQVSYIWFKGETPEQIYNDNFMYLTRDFEQNFQNKKITSNKSTFDTGNDEE